LAFVAAAAPVQQPIIHNAKDTLHSIQSEKAQFQVKDELNFELPQEQSSGGEAP